MVNIHVEPIIPNKSEEYIQSRNRFVTGICAQNMAVIA